MRVKLVTRSHPEEKSGNCPHHWQCCKHWHHVDTANTGITVKIRLQFSVYTLYILTSFMDPSYMRHQPSTTPDLVPDLKGVVGSRVTKDTQEAYNPFWPQAAYVTLLTSLHSHSTITIIGFFSSIMTLHVLPWLELTMLL